MTPEEYAGKSILIRTVTHYYVGKCTDFNGSFLRLAPCAWIPDTGRWSSCLKSGDLKAVEPYPGAVSIHIDAIVDITLWEHPLPREPKP